MAIQTSKPISPKTSPATVAQRASESATSLPRTAHSISARPLGRPERELMICEAAYYIAERRGFESGHELDDWLAAEKQVDAVLTRAAPPQPVR
jgi:hypothetical protein